MNLVEKTDDRLMENNWVDKMNLVEEKIVEEWHVFKEAKGEDPMVILEDKTVDKHPREAIRCSFSEKFHTDYKRKLTTEVLGHTNN